MIDLMEQQQSIPSEAVIHVCRKNINKNYRWLQIQQWDK